MIFSKIQVQEGGYLELGFVELSLIAIALDILVKLLKLES